MSARYKVSFLYAEESSSSEPVFSLFSLNADERSFSFDEEEDEIRRITDKHSKKRREIQSAYKLFDRDITRRGRC